MADGVTQVAPDSTGDKIDMTELTVGANTVSRQRINITDPDTAAGLMRVLNSEPVGTEYGAVARLAGVAEVASLPQIYSANFTRPANVTAYTIGDLVANSTTAGSVTALTYSSVGRSAPGRAWILGAKIKTSSIVITNKFFRIHFFTTSPTVANGDNGVFSKAEQGHIGSIDVNLSQIFTDASTGFGGANYGPIPVDLASGQTVYALLEARGSFTPISAEVFTVDITVAQ